MIQYLLYQFAHALLTRLPLRFSYWISDRVADLHFVFSLNSRRQILKNFYWILGRRERHDERKAREVFRNFGKNLVDFLCLSCIDKEAFFRRVRVKGLHYVSQTLSCGKGAIGVTAHLGNWEWGGVGLSLLGFPVHALVLSQQNRWVNQFFINQRVRKGVQVIDLTDSIWKVIQRLDKNEMILLVTDREISNNGIPVSFLGRKVYFPRGPAALSRRCGSPLVFGFMVRRENGFFDLEFQVPIEPIRTHDPSSDLERMTQQMASIIEVAVRRYPTQWFHFQGLREVPAT
ncbi:MAG: lysophospholipid acyltransferase family protein [Candidatus Omnitrophota bacterium]